MRALGIIAALVAAGCNGAAEVVERTVPRNTEVSLDGDRFLADHSDLKWRLEQRPAGSTAEIADLDLSTTSFFADLDGIYVAALYSGAGPSVAELYRVRISAENFAPIISLPAPPTSFDTGPLNFEITAIDPNDDSVTVEVAIIEAPTGANLDVEASYNPFTETYVVRLDPGVPGDYTLEVTATDDLGARGEETFELPVLPGAHSLGIATVAPPVYSGVHNALLLPGGDQLAVFDGDTRTVELFASFVGPTQTTFTGASVDRERALISNGVDELRFFDLGTRSFTQTVTGESFRGQMFENGGRVFYKPPGAPFSSYDIAAMTSSAAAAGNCDTVLVYLPTKMRVYCGGRFSDTTAYDVSQVPPVHLWTLDHRTEVMFPYRDGSKVIDIGGRILSVGDTVDTDLVEVATISQRVRWADHSAIRGEVIAIDQNAQVIGRYDDETLQLIAAVSVPGTGSEFPKAVFFEDSGEAVLVGTGSELGSSIDAVGWVPLP